jgi:drug/metabolite transporter (DMT)-like permease
MHPGDWLLLVLLSVLWGASFLFNSLALRELPPFTIAFARVFFGAAMLLPLLGAFGDGLPRRPAGWLPFLLMGLLNNVIPFVLVLIAQTCITGGLASVLNATTPLFSVIVLGAFGDERLEPRRILGVLIGLAGVAVLRDPEVGVTGTQTVGMLLSLGAALSYAFCGLWGRRKLIDVAPITSSACQLLCSSVVLGLLACAVDRPWQLPMPGPLTWLALFGIAALSTALAYVVFFRVLVRSGATNVMLVTLLIPVTAIVAGYLLLGEPLSTRELVGAAFIGGALVVIDGRLLARLRPARA